MTKLKIAESISGKEPAKAGLLFQYIDQQVKGYEEPTRLGTPRGDKIGFPLNKYILCLIAGLTNYSLRAIGDEYGKNLGVSYGLLRKWNSEPDFKALKHEAQKEFAYKVYKFVRSELEEYLKENHDYSEGRSDNKPSPPDLEIFERNLKVLNSDVFHELIKLISARLKELPAESDEHMVEAKLFYEIVLFIEFAFDQDISGHDYKKIAQEVLISQITECIKLLDSKRNLKIKEQRKITGCLEMAAEYIKNY
jgi:hypothetical protein